MLTKNNKVRIIFYITLFMFLVIFDQFTKSLAVINLKDNDPFVIIKGVFEFKYLTGGNTGAAWGILSGKIPLFIVITIIVSIALVFAIYRLEVCIRKSSIPSYKAILLQLVFVCLIAGAVGNLIDRVVQGYVVDFLYFKLIDFPIFNVADCYVTVSAVLLFIICLLVFNEDEFDKVFSIRRKKNDAKLQNNED